MGAHALPLSSSPTGYVNPDAGNAPIERSAAQYVVLAANSGRTGNAGRNTERTPGQNTPSVSPFAPRPGTLSSNANTAASGRFLNATLMDGGGRVIRYQLKLIF